MQRQTRIKMCGMTREADVLAACEAGADAIGMVFYPPSPRAVDLEQAGRLAAIVKPGVTTTVLVVNADAGFVREVLSETRAELIQFHGDESPEFCQQFGVRYLKAIRVQSSEQLQSQLSRHADADGLLLDAYVKGQPGGTGQTFDWSVIPQTVRERLFLAGGLTVTNVQEAIEQVRPYAVDVSGGIELEKGVKSAGLIERFVAGVRAADARVNEISS